MAVSGVGSVNSSTGTGFDASSVKNMDMSVDDFFTLLVAQMKNQNMLNPTSDTEFVSQMAQFSTLQQLTKLQSTFESSMTSSMLGKNIKGTAYELKTNEVDGQTVEYLEKVEIQGKVEKISFINGKTVMTVNGHSITMEDITEITN